MVGRIVYGVAVFGLLLALAGCGRGEAILQAAETGDAKTVERLLKKDPSLVHAKRFGPGWGPLELAARRGHSEVVALLLAASAPIEAGAISDAAVGGHIKIIEMFLARGVDINGPADLMGGAVTGGSTTLVHWLLAHGASVEGKPGSSMGPLENAASRGHKAVAEILLAHGARADAKNEAGRTPLLMAAFEGSTDIAELLIQHGAKVNDATTKGATPLMRAADSHAVGMVKLLLEHGADVNARDNDQDTALTYAVRRRLAGTAEEQAEIQQLGGMSAKKNGEEVWVTVIKRRRAAVVELLLAHGADVNARNNNQETASSLAMKQDCLSCEGVVTASGSAQSDAVRAVLNVVIYIVAAAIGLVLSCLSLVFALLSGPEFASLILGLLVAAHIGSCVYVRRKAMQGKGRRAAIVLVLPLPVVMSVLYVFSVGSQAISSLFERESSTFASACQTAGAKFYKSPALPVHSIAYDWQSRTAPIYNDYSLEFGGRVSPLARPDSRYPGTIMSSPLPIDEMEKSWRPCMWFD